MSHDLVARALLKRLHYYIQPDQSGDQPTPHYEDDVKLVAEWLEREVLGREMHPLQTELRGLRDVVARQRETITALRHVSPGLNEFHAALYEVAKQTCHQFGMPWTDPRTHVTYPPPDVSAATRAATRQSRAKSPRPRAARGSRPKR